MNPVLKLTGRRAFGQVRGTLSWPFVCDSKVEVLGCLSQGLSVTLDGVSFNMIEVGPQKPLSHSVNIICEFVSCVTEHFEPVFNILVGACTS